jgi:hypothetical protein
MMLVYSIILYTYQKGIHFSLKLKVIHELNIFLRKVLFHQLLTYPLKNLLPLSCIEIQYEAKQIAQLLSEVSKIFLHHLFRNLG